MLDRKNPVTSFLDALTPYFHRFLSLSITQSRYDVNTVCLSVCRSRTSALGLIHIQERSSSLGNPDNTLPDTRLVKAKNGFKSKRIPDCDMIKKKSEGDCETNNRGKDQMGKHLTRVWMKGYRLKRMTEQGKNGWLKGSKRQEQSPGLKMPLMSCLREIESRHSVSESEISHWGDTGCSPFVQREIFTFFTAQLAL